MSVSRPSTRLILIFLAVVFVFAASPVRASIGYLLELDVDDNKYTNPMPQSPLKGYRIEGQWFSQAVVGIDLAEPDGVCSFRVWSDQHEYTAEGTSDAFGTCFFEFTVQYSGVQTQYHYQAESAGESASQRDFTVLPQSAHDFSGNGISWVNAPTNIASLPAVITVSLNA